jgi:hypothetical protein
MRPVLSVLDNDPHKERLRIYVPRSRARFKAGVGMERWSQASVGFHVTHDLVLKVVDKHQLR